MPYFVKIRQHYWPDFAFFNPAIEYSPKTTLNCSSNYCFTMTQIFQQI